MSTHAAPGPPMPLVASALLGKLAAAAQVTTSINTVCVRARKIRTTKYRDRAKVLGRQ